MFKRSSLVLPALALLSTIPQVAHACLMESAWGRQQFFEALGRGACFRPEAIDGAIRELRRAERDPNAEQGGRSSRVLTGYLRAAMQSRDPAAAGPGTSDGFLEWFQKHPARTEDK